MKRSNARFLLVLFLLVSANAARANVSLLMSKGPSLPGDATLNWTGDIPIFHVFRNDIPVGVANPPNVLVITEARQTVDSQIPPPGHCYFYNVMSLGPCSPLDPAPVCGTAKHCFPTEDGVTSCSEPAGAGTTCSLCSSHADCTPIDFCNSGACTQWCRAGTSADCPLGQSCFAVLPLHYAGTQQYGVCGCF